MYRSVSLFYFSLPNNCFKLEKLNTLLSVCCLFFGGGVHCGGGGRGQAVEISALPLSSSSSPPLHVKIIKNGERFCFYYPHPPVYARECQWKTFCVVRLKPRERRTCIYAYCSLSHGLVRGFFCFVFFLLPCLKMFQRFTKYNIKMRNKTCFLKKKKLKKK